MNKFYLRTPKWFLKAAGLLSVGLFLIYVSLSFLSTSRFTSWGLREAFLVTLFFSAGMVGIVLIYLAGRKMLQLFFKIPSLSFDESGFTFWSKIRGRTSILWREIAGVKVTEVSGGPWAKYSEEWLNFYDFRGKIKFQINEDDVHVPLESVLESIRNIPAAAHLLSESPKNGAREFGVPTPLSRPKAQTSEQRNLPLGGALNLEAEFSQAEPKYRALLLADSNRSLVERKKLAQIFVPQIRQLPPLQALQCLEILWQDSSFSNLGHGQELEEIGMDALKKALESSDAKQAWLSLRKYSGFLPVATLLPEIMRVTELYSSHDFEAAMLALKIVKDNLPLTRLSLIDACNSLQGTISFCTQELAGSEDLNEGNIHFSSRFPLLLYFLGDDVRARALREKFWGSFRNLSRNAPIGVFKLFLPNDQRELELLGAGLLLENFKSFPVSEDARIESEVLNLMVELISIEHLQLLLLERLELMKQKHPKHRWEYTGRGYRFVTERDELIESVVKNFCSGN